MEVSRNAWQCPIEACHVRAKRSTHKADARNGPDRPTAGIRSGAGLASLENGDDDRSQRRAMLRCFRPPKRPDEGQVDLEGSELALYEAIKELRGEKLAEKLRQHLPQLVREGYTEKSDLLDPVLISEVGPA